MRRQLTIPVYADTFSRLTLTCANCITFVSITCLFRLRPRLYVTSCSCVIWLEIYTLYISLLWTAATSHWTLQIHTLYIIHTSSTAKARTPKPVTMGRDEKYYNYDFDHDSFTTKVMYNCIMKTYPAPWTSYPWQTWLFRTCFHSCWLFIRITVATTRAPNSSSYLPCTTCHCALNCK